MEDSLKGYAARSMMLLQHADKGFLLHQFYYIEV